MASADSFILTYHSLDESGSVISVTPQLFRRQMAVLNASGRKVVPLELITVTPNAAAITFDDGYENFFEQALPVLDDFGFPSTVFAVTRLCGQRSAWAGSGPGKPLMDWSQLRQLWSHRVSVGAHTATHADLRKLAPEAAAGELDESRCEIEQRTGRKVRAFAYPYGVADAQVRQLAGERFDWCCSVELDFVRAGADPAFLPRLDMYYFQAAARFESLVAGKAEQYVAARRSLRRIRAMIPFARF
ncbi:polysaccharide deacetylase family protein [Paludibaculum fermentans]|uniref:polysaccharide deacetylase family protein n=1 Tax=Paludibaculum fermentans TaxID=1473598 RepID=UPI003EBFBF76